MSNGCSPFSFSEPNSGKIESSSSEEQLSRGYSSGVESGLVQTDSRPAPRQLQSAETEEVTSCLGDALFDDLLFLMLRLFLDDFLGGSANWDAELLSGLGGRGVVRSLVKW